MFHRVRRASRSLGGRGGRGWIAEAAFGTILLGLGAPACRSSAERERSPDQHQGFELLYRKPSGAPISADEAEGLAAVLQGRIACAEPEWEFGLSVGPDGMLHLMLPDADDEARVSVLRPGLERVGRLSFEGVAGDSTPGWDAKHECRRLREWWEAQPSPDLQQYNALSPEDGGPPAIVRWREMPEAEQFSEADGWNSALPCLRMDVAHPGRDWSFGSDDLAQVYLTVAYSGDPAIGFELRVERQQAFTDMTAAYTSQLLAIVLDDVVLSVPTIAEPLRGHAIISGRFEQAEAASIVATLCSGPLPTPLEFVELRGLPAR